MSTQSEKPSVSAVAPFATAFQRSATWEAWAPGRVNLIGEHIDYNDGFVLPAAINLHVAMAAAPTRTREIRIRSRHVTEEAGLDLDNFPSPDGVSAPWIRYPLGVLVGFLETGANVPGMDIWVESNLPLGGGLSSSAALEVAFASLLECASGHRLTDREKALLCQRAEHEFAGVPCGIMDQFASVMGIEDHFLLIDCRSQDVTPVAFRNDSVSLLIANTNVRHNLASSEYEKRKVDCDTALSQLRAASWRDVRNEDLAAASGLLGDTLGRRARHVVTEIERTQEAVEAIREHDWQGLGELMFASHDSLAQDFEVSCPELDVIVDAARQLGIQGGVYGARMTGGGFGGSTISLIRRDQAEAVVAFYRRLYQDRTGIPLDTFIIRPSSGTQSHILA